MEQKDPVEVQGEGPLVQGFESGGTGGREEEGG